MVEPKKIEKYFLLVLLRISIIGVAIILISDTVLYPDDRLSIIIDSVILATCVVAMLLRNRSFPAAVLTITGSTWISMIFQSLAVPVNTSTSFAILLLVGFVYSILLKGKLMNIMHLLLVISMLVIFAVQWNDASLRVYQSMGDFVSLFVTYLVLYFILTYCTAVLKSRYDSIHDHLRATNLELQEKTKEVEAQNEELLQIQDNLNMLNADLETLVHERTNRIKAQNEILLRYTYTNAHHLRGPVARLLGLVTIQRMESAPDNKFFFDRIEDQAHEIDQVVKQINEDLQANGLLTELTAPQ